VYLLEHFACARAGENLDTRALTKPSASGINLVSLDVLVPVYKSVASRNRDAPDYATA